LALVVNEPTPKKRRPLSLADAPQKKAKLHPAVELLSTLSTAVEKAASQKAQAKVLELAASNSRTEAEAKWKSRELDILEKKNGFGDQKSRSGAKHSRDAGKGAAAVD
jgi:hypothetical protein